MPPLTRWFVRSALAWMLLALAGGVLLATGVATHIPEVLITMERPPDQQRLSAPRQLFPTRHEWSDSRGPIARGTVIGFFLGVLPGGGATIASIASYVAEKRFARNRQRLGHGAIEGVAGPEAANNAAATGSFIPLLTLGIPANVVMGMMLAALTIHGVRPGPLLLHDRPDLFWGVITSMYLGNIMLLVLNLPLVGLFIHILRIPYPVLAPLILLFCLQGNPYDRSHHSRCALSMDAFAVSVGLGAKRSAHNVALKAGIFFGGFQALMPFIGYMGGKGVLGWIEAYTRWIAFGLLVLVGAKMIYEGFQEGIEEDISRITNKVMLILAVATSIDAMAAGFSLALLDANPYVACLVIGAITFAFSVVGVRVGERSGTWLESRAEIFGGAVLVLMGFRFLFF